MPGQPGKTSGLAFYLAANWRRAGVVILVVPMWGLQPISVLQQIQFLAVALCYRSRVRLCYRSNVHERGAYAASKI